jgi:hypothetical protein
MAEAEFAAPARKSYRGKGKGRDRGPARRKHPSAGKQHKESEQKTASSGSAPAPASLKGDDRNTEQPNEGGEGEAGQNDLDLEKLLDQVSNDHWYALPGNNSTSFQWPHLDKVPLGFELEALQIDLPKDLFELDLGALERSLSGLPAHKLTGGLERSSALLRQYDEEAILEGEERASKDDSSSLGSDSNPNHCITPSTDQTQTTKHQAKEREREAVGTMGKGNDDDDEEGELDDLLQLSLEETDRADDVTETEEREEKLLGCASDDVDVDDEDAELDALLGM